MKKGAIQNILVFISLIIAGLALVVSYFSYQISNEALNLNKEKYAIGYNTNIIGDFSQHPDSAYFKPSNKNIELLNIKFVFPKNFKKGDAVIFGPNPEIYTELLINPYESYLKENIITENFPSSTVMFLPIGIRINYLIRGERFSKTQIYNLLISTIQSNDDLKLKGRNLEFIKNLEPSIDRNSFKDTLIARLFKTKVYRTQIK